MPDVSVNGTTLHYEEAGTGDPLLLLHGGLGTALLHFWRDIPFFAEHYRVVAPDLRGYGRSSPPREFPADFYERDAADVAALIERVIGGPAHVLGWSDGAIVGLLLAATRSDLVQSLISVAGEAQILEEERVNWPPLADTDTWSEGALRRFREAQGKANWPGILQKMVDGYNRFMDERGGEVSSRLLSNIRCPVLLVHGDADPVVPVTQLERVSAGIPHAETRIFEGAGHQPYREREQEFRALALDFLGRHAFTHGGTPSA